MLDKTKNDEAEIIGETIVQKGLYIDALEMDKTRGWNVSTRKWPPYLRKPLSARIG